MIEQWMSLGDDLIDPMQVDDLHIIMFLSSAAVGELEDDDVIIIIIAFRRRPIPN